MKDSKELLDINNRRNKIALILAAILDIEKDQTYSAEGLNVHDIVNCVTGFSDNHEQAHSISRMLLAKFPKMSEKKLKFSLTEALSLIEYLVESACLINEMEESKLNKNMPRFQLLTDWYQGKILLAKHGGTLESRILNTIFDRSEYFIKNLEERSIAYSTDYSPAILILWFKSESIVQKPTVSSAATAVNATVSLPFAAHKQ